MSVPYHKEILNTGNVRLMVNFTNIKSNIADEGIKLTFYAIDKLGEPIFTEELGIEDIRDLYNHLDSISVIKKGASKSSTIIEKTEELNLLIQELESLDIEKLFKVLNKFSTEEKLSGLLNTLSDIEIDHLQGAIHHKIISTELAKLSELIRLDEEGSLVEVVKHEKSFKKYSAGQPEKIFQNWIEENQWIFGVDYVKQHESRRIALFSEADLLMESVDGYLDLIELKRPTQSLLKYDKSHSCYFLHPDLSHVIGQALFYLQKLSEYKLNIENEYELKVIMPRVKIIAGRSNHFDQQQKDCIRMLNSNLNHISVVTYDDLVSYGSLLLQANKGE